MAWSSSKGSDKDRLGRMYGEMSDRELLEMHGTMADLTEVAQEALRAEMGRRGLEPAADDADPAEVPAPLEGEGEGLKVVHVFHQTFEAERAFTALEREGVEFKVRDFSVDEKGEPRPGPAIQLALLVSTSDWGRTIAILRRDAGLFPLPVADEGNDGEPEGEAEEMFPAAQFESEEEAETAARLLQGAGIAYRRERLAEEGWEGFAIEVKASDVERAVAVLERLLDEAPAEGE